MQNSQMVGRWQKMTIWEYTWLGKEELAVDKELCIQVWQQQHAQK